MTKEVAGFFFTIEGQTSRPSKSVISKSETFAYNKITNGGEKNCCFCANAEGTDS